MFEYILIGFVIFMFSVYVAREFSRECPYCGYKGYLDYEPIDGYMLLETDSKYTCPKCKKEHIIKGL